ncbi:MAG: hypothetical protein KGM42_08500 [Hyphomicrobiales bacterium]|nr:hypothetical protein [Hyphomicrobiales bacterium]
MTSSRTMAGLLFAGAIILASPLRAQTLCDPTETSAFSCALKTSGKIVSLCASADLGKTTGYLQYRFGTPGKVELAVPGERTGTPGLALTRSADAHATYDDLTFSRGPYVYEITSFRQLTPKNGDGFPTPPSSDTLGVRDDRRSMKQGDWVFNDECASLGAPLDVIAIANKIGAEVARGGF